MSKLKEAVVWCYHKMQQNYFTFSILVWLKEHGVTRKVHAWVNSGNDIDKVGQHAEAMRKSKVFFEDNAGRIEKMLTLLSDDFSRDVWKEAVRCRIDHIPIRSGFYSEGDQYFVKDLIKFNDDEVFIDGGGYTGDTTQQFINMAKKAGIRFKRIVIFEPDEKNCNLMRKFYGKRKNVSVIQKGLSDEEKMLSFAGDGPVFRVVETKMKDAEILPVTNIDSVSECQNATWIKMDIEGSELDALKGARQVIQRNRPKLTICIYHSDEHMIGIIEYVHELVPEYRLYIRQHRRIGGETVLYAIP